MKAVEYPHQTFLKENNIDVEKLPKLIKQRIRGFEEIQEDLPYLVEEDQPVIEETLQKLSYEIEEDLEEEFEELLENNEIEEELVEVEQAQVIQVDSQDPELPEEEHTSVDEALEEFIAELKPGPPTPEERLDEVYGQGIRKLYPYELKEIGIPIPNEKLTTIGNFCLVKGRYQNCYTLILRKEKVKEK